MSNYLEGDWHRYIIEGLMMPGGVYIEVGVRNCETITQVYPHCHEAHGVDIDVTRARLMPEGSVFWGMPSNEFWMSYEGSPADVIFIDADHSAAAVRSDFEHAVRKLAKNGIIALHDTWPYLDGALHANTGEAWLVSHGISHDPTYSSVTIPRFPGLTLVRVNGD